MPARSTYHEGALTETIGVRGLESKLGFLSPRWHLLWSPVMPGHLHALPVPSSCPQSSHLGSRCYNLGPKQQLLCTLSCNFGCTRLVLSVKTYACQRG